MSSRKRKATVRVAQDTSASTPTPPPPATGEGQRTATYLERRRRREEHAAAQVQLRALRRSTRSALDWLDTANTEARWDYAVLHTRETDGLGAPLLRPAVAGWLDGQRGARFQAAWHDLLLDVPPAAAALWAVVLAAQDQAQESDGSGGLCLAEERVACLAEEAAALGLAVAASVVRRRAGVAVRLLQEQCRGDLPPALKDYATVRRERWSRYGRARAAGQRVAC